MTDTTEIPNDKLAQLLINEAKQDCEINVHAPDKILEEPWEWLDAMTVTDVEADFENFDDVIVHGETETAYQEEALAATRTNPASYERVDCTVGIGIWWTLDPEDTAELMFEVYEQ